MKETPSKSIVDQINESPEEEPEFRTLWAVKGTDVPPKFRWPWQKKHVPESQFWRLLYRSKEEAEAHAALTNELWKWNGTPAVPELLRDAIAQARIKGNAGIQVMGYDGGWRVLAEFPAGKPLPEELR